MSFILDALRKSESDRLKRDVPGFSDVPDVARQKSASHWMGIIIVLIVINIVVLTVMYMRPDRSPDTVVAGTPADSAKVAPAEPEIAPIAANTGRSQPVVAASIPAPAATVAVAPAPQKVQPAASVPANRPYMITESLATFNDLRAQGRLRLGDLHLDIHVYSREAKDRFVFVNMSKYKEKTTLDEGPVVVEITPEGVILEYLGTEFLLPRE